MDYKVNTIIIYIHITWQRIHILKFLHEEVKHSPFHNLPPSTCSVGNGRQLCNGLCHKLRKEEESFFGVKYSQTCVLDRKVTCIKKLYSVNKGTIPRFKTGLKTGFLRKFTVIKCIKWSTIQNVVYFQDFRMFSLFSVAVPGVRILSIRYSVSFN